MRDGNAPVLARWAAEGTHRLLEWETDLSSQTGASQAGILLGSNEDIPAFRWVEKETARLIACSGPADCAEIERRLSTGKGLLANGGASRGNLLSGDADHTILTVSRIEAEKGPNPGYRAFFANGYNVVRTLVLLLWEVVLELTAAARQRRRDVHPRGHRGGIYPLLRAAVCVFARDLIVYGVLTDMMKGRPAIYATFSSYDEVAHHSGLERPDTLEALRKLDQQFGRIDAARRFAPRPYEIVVLSDHGQTQGATFKQRNGYGLDELVRRSLSSGGVAAMASGDENASTVDSALVEATGKKAKKDKNDVSGESVVVLGSGNLGLVYLMDEPRRLTLEEIDARHPDLVAALRSHPHVGWLLVRSAERGPLVLGAGGSRELATGRIEGEDPLAPFGAERAGAPAPQRLLRARARHPRGQLLRPVPPGRVRLRGADLLPRRPRRPADPPVHLRPGRPARAGGPARRRGSVHTLLSGWRALLNGAGAEKREPGAGARRRRARLAMAVRSPGRRERTRARQEALRARAERLSARAQTERSRHASVDAVFDVVDRDAEVGGGIIAGALAYRFFFWSLPFALVLVAGLGVAADANSTSPEKAAHALGLAGLISSSVASAASSSTRCTRSSSASRCCCSRRGACSGS